ncbi:hypothetical protein [Umezawaea beigongshangensis]|nr:hypothetical protein [Umezawaea beigongshangensis]
MASSTERGGPPSPDGRPDVAGPVAGDTAPVEPHPGAQLALGG